MTAGFQHKIVDGDQLDSIVAGIRRSGRTVVQCHGCFDIVHPGHIRYLQFARQQGDVLIVSITGDSNVDKGADRPYIPQELRAENLAALMFVDYVCIHAAATAEALLARIRPDVYVKGAEYEHTTDARFLAEKSVVESYGGRLIFSSGEIVFSSTELIERIQDDRTDHERLPLFCKRHDITHESIDDLLLRLRYLHVLVVGDIVLDRYVFCDALGVAHEAPMMSLVQRDERTYLGGAAVVARHVAALGASAFLLSAGAGDDTTNHIRGVLDHDGIETSLIESRPSLVEKTRFVAENNKLFKVDRGQRHPLDSVAERQAAVVLEQQARRADAVIICDFGYGMITGSLLTRVLPALRQNVPVLTADVSGGQASLLEFRHVDLLCPTEREARATLNDHSSGLSALAWKLMEKTQARRLFITLEKRGMVVFDRQTQRRDSPEWGGRLKSEQLPALADHPIDLLGCGDALLAASTLTLAAGGSLMSAAYVGAVAAALEASTLGNQPIEAKNLRRWLGDRRELICQATKRHSEVERTPTKVKKVCEPHHHA